MKLIDHISDPLALEGAWRRVVSKPITSPRRKSQLSQLVERKDQILCKLQADLKDGTYRFKEPQLICLPSKKSSHDSARNRPILTLSPQDMVVEVCVFRALRATVTESLALKNTFARRARPGESRSFETLCQQVVKYREKQGYVFESDIKRFFPSIKHHQLFKTFRLFEEDESLDFLLKQVVNRRPKEPISEELRDFFNGTDRGIPQGSCLSPLLASIYLYPLDKELHDANISYVRYVDDIVFFASSEQEALEMEKHFHEELLKLELQAHRSDIPGDNKAQICGPKDPFEFVGYSFNHNGEVYPNPEAFRSFEQRLSSISKEATSLYDLLDDLSRFIEGWWAAYSHCNWTSSRHERLKKLAYLEVRTWMDKRGLKTSRGWDESYSKRYERIGLPPLIRTKTPAPLLLDEEFDTIASGAFESVSCIEGNQ